MARLQARPEVVSEVIESVRFSFYTDVEVRAISVKQITSPILFDSFQMPVRGGLYDPALGPIDQNVKCTTCGEPSSHCSGHFGHISLILPVYNPMDFKMLVKILRCTCIYCHHFKMNQKRVATYVKKLSHILAGRMVEAMGIYTKSADEMETAVMEDLEALSDDEAMSDAEIDDKPNDRREQQLTCVQVAASTELMKQFFSDMPKTKCGNCGANVPTLKNEGVGKIFQTPLPKRRLHANLTRGIKFDAKAFLRTSAVKAPDDEDDEISNGVEGQGLTGGLLESIVEVVKGKKKTGQAPVFAIDPRDLESSNEPRFLTSMEVKAHMRLLWEKEADVCSLMWGAERGSLLSGKGSGSSMFFLQDIVVTPNRFRPPNKVENNLLEHPQNVFYSRVIQTNMALIEAARNSKVDLLRATQLWLNLQNSVNSLLDSSTAGKQAADMGAGVRQLLEKKEGLFRMNMMGKRVNYSCRSVISPDPYIAVNEIGIPPYFATRLTYPERVTPWNAQVLRAAVENGATVHPGATHIEDEQGNVTNLANLPKFKRTALSKTLLSTPGAAASSTVGSSHSENLKAAGKIVYRHLHDGDILLVNRQPTLHKPGVMAHRARVLKGEKTLRLHYANCSTYNADFDGDEMNVHFPQEELGRAEAFEIVNADQQTILSVQRY